MDSPWFLLAISTAIFVSLVLLVVLCLDCRKKGPLVSIRETDPSEDYNNPPPITHPFAIHQTTDLRSMRSPSTLSPNSLSNAPGSHWQHRSVTPTETESNPSYENPVPEVPVDSDADDPGYIIVLPNDEVSPSANQSRASTPSLDPHEYVNLQEEDSDYLNVKPINSIVQKAEPQSNTDEEEDDEEDDEDSDDDAGNYVNELPIIHMHSNH